MWGQQSQRRPTGLIAIPGLRALVTKVPDLREPEGMSQALLTFGGAFSAAYGQMRRWDRSGPLWTFVSQLLAYAAITRLLWSLFANAPRLREEHGPRAYQEAFFRYFLPAAGPMIASFLHIAIVPGTRTLPRPFMLPGAYLLATGLGLWLRAIQTLGIDTATAVYVYFPEEGRQITWSAYRILRHPLYAAVARVFLGIALMRRKVRAVALALLALGWLHLVVKLEERELVQRFGRSYEEYRERTPAIIPNSLQTELQLLRAILGEG